MTSLEKNARIYKSLQRIRMELSWIWTYYLQEDDDAKTHSARPAPPNLAERQMVMPDVLEPRESSQPTDDPPPETLHERWDKSG